jgi:hypothetical protein
MGYSKDAWAVLQYDWLGLPAPLTNWFTLNPSTGAVTVGPAANLNFLVAKSYNLTARVTYVQLGLTDTAAVTVWINEINKPAVWTGLYNASTSAPMSSITISETTAPGTPVGVIAFSDVNTAWPWNARIYGVVQNTYGSNFFTVNSSTGVIQVTPAAVGAMSWWDSPTYSLTVSCTDADPLAPITVTRVVSIVLVQVNTVTIAGFGVPASTFPTFGVNVTDGGATQVRCADRI